MNGFRIYVDSEVLREDIRGTVVRDAQKRLTRKRADLFIEKSKGIPALKHSDLELGDHLGSGSFSSVYKVKSIRSSRHRRKRNAEELAVKILRPSLIKDPVTFSSCAADLFMEALFLASLEHKNILHIHGGEAHGVLGYANGRHDAFFLVLERLDKTLKAQLDAWALETARIQRSPFHRSTRRRELLQEKIDVILQLSSAVRYLHSKRLLHRDLKPDNIGFQGNTLKLFDFDKACVLPDNSAGEERELFNLSPKVGSRRYMSPEVALGKRYHWSADVYSVALLIHEILSLKKPYEHLSRADSDQIIHMEGVRPSIPTSWPQGFQDLIQSGWARDPLSRPSMSDFDESLVSELQQWLDRKQEPSSLPVLYQRMSSPLANLRKRKKGVAVPAA